MMTFLNRETRLWTIGLTTLLFTITATLAAPGNIANSPLFTTNSIEPNVFFEVDDSGSMDWEILTKQYWHICAYSDRSSNSCGSIKADGLHRIFTGNSWRTFEYIFDNNDDAYTNGCEFGRETLESCSIATQNFDWRVKSSSVNVLYYNPESNYLPWKNADGTIMSNASFTSARSDPQVGAIGYSELRNLASNRLARGFVYNVWRDTHGFIGTRPNSISSDKIVGENEIVDWWDEHLRYTVNVNNITIEQITYIRIGTVETETISNTTILTGSGNHVLLNNKTIAETQQNIANWYQYSRRRSFVTKSAIASVVADNPNYRYGLNFINNKSFPYDGGTSRLVEVPIANASLSHNDALLTGLNRLDWPAYGTPLRKGLERAGQYFDNKLSGKTNPITEQCQQNFTVLFTDGYWNGNDPESTIADADGDGQSITVADVAKYYYDKDLSPLADNVNGNIFDPVSHQHMVTYTVAFGVTGNLSDTDNNGWPGNAPGLFESSNWGTLSFSNQEKIDDLWHAAYNSKGTYVSAETPKDVSEAMKEALANISDRVGSAASVAFNTTTLTGSSAVYLAQFNSANNQWSGDLLSFPLDLVTGSVAVVANWTASTVLDAKLSPETTRNIFTYNGTDGVPFTWGNLTAIQQGDLKINPDNTVSSDAKAQARLNFLRGDSSNEEGSAGTYNFRHRVKLLGDIVHSDPVFVGQPELFWPKVPPFPAISGSTYDDFKGGAAKTREAIIYVGANDGMLHGFNASDGSEAFAYIPKSIFSSSSATTGLHYLTNTNYTHRYYVDMPSTISDVYIDTGVGDAWHTILLGGERAGGKGLFALDITEPSKFIENSTNAANLVLWEFDQGIDADMGFTFSRPTIAMMNNGRWAAIFGNGFNNEGDGEAKLFIIFLDGGLDGIWTDGSAGSDLDYLKITTKVGSIVSSDCSHASSDCNGLSSPQAVDMNGDKVIDRVYAGDLKGNMWVFDVSSVNESHWDSSYKTGGTPKPLFISSHSGVIQAITNKPILVKHPEGLGGTPDVLVFFGTGQYLVSSDVSNTDIQSFYGVWDNGSHSLTPSDLIEQNFVSEVFTNDGTDVSNQARVVTDTAVDYTGEGKGWVINLTEAPGERVIVDPDIRGDLVFFNTWIPDKNPCNAGGSGVLMSVKQINGGRPDKPAFDFNNDGIVNVDDLVKVTTVDGDGNIVEVTYTPSGENYNSGLPASSSFLSGKQYTPGTDGGSTIEVRDVETLSDDKTGRLSWQELKR